MRKVGAVLFILAMLLAVSTAASANLLVNPGFEAGSTGWTLSGGTAVTNDTNFVRNGNRGALEIENGSASQSFIIPNTSLLEFGSWIKLFTNDTSGNFDQAQINLWLFSQSTGQTIGGSVGQFGPFSPDPNFIGFQSTPWLRLSGLIDVSGLEGTSALININLQNFTSPVSFMAADDAFVRPVPEPCTLLLLGSGLIGLAGWRRRRG